MRIIAGKHRGRRIETIDDKKLRPTTGMAREAVFNILSHGRFLDGRNNLLDGCRVLDLFCGCGALAMEALSRGAAHVTLIDIDQKHLEVARHNIEKIGEGQNATFLRRDSSNPPAARTPCNLVFVDPPYKQNLAATVLNKLEANNWLEDGAIIVVETGKKEDLPVPEKYVELDCRTYGNCCIRILQWNRKEA